jgi:hypothetical protein
MPCTFYMNLSALVKTTSIATLLLAASTLFALETNEWTKTTDGKWEEPFWSLGRLPDASQSILLSGDTVRTVKLDAITAQQAGDSMTVNQLVVTGKTTVLLDHLPASNSLRVDSGTNHFDTLVLETDSTLINLDSTLIVGNPDAGTLKLRHSRFFQDGGSVQARSAFIYLGAEYHLTNGIFESEFFTLGVGSFIYRSFFNQYGGTAKVGTFDLDAETYQLFGGDLIIRSNASLKGGAFIQRGGTHRVSSLSVFQSYNGGGPGFYSLEGGTLSVSNASLGAFLSGSTFQQTDGTFYITNAFTLSGSSRYHPPHQIPATYALTNGTMRARIVELNSRWGLAEFSQKGGNVSISEVLRLNVPDADTRSYLSLDAGVLHTATIIAEGAGADILQTGGELIATYGFQFRGFIPPPSWAAGDRRVPVYQFLGGTLGASDLEIAGEMLIGSSTARQRISNPGTFKLAGILRAGDCDEELGSFILATNSLIDLDPGNAKLNFTSASTNWNPDAVLMITNWAGSLDGRGDDQITFRDRSSVTSQQLSKIRFINPARLASGEYPADILPTGEIVPRNLPAISFIPAPTKITLQWSEPSVLQTSTNVTGPYEDVSAAKSPYEVNITEGTQRYFRLK